MIEGVKVKKLRVIPDERGRLMEILRSDEEFFDKFGQVYLTTALPGIVKAWHYHRKQTDHFLGVIGKARVALYDSREDSPTFKEVNEFILELANPFLLKIPPLVYHGFKCISKEEASIINIPTQLYDYDNPDELRVDPYENDIPYDWKK
ncbi:MAG: dTDP-4-dehydrorhamnose 3,5-epimerase [Nitrospirae bacterium]|nr:dTDP-4-dehydrorhamnose 3,5-epimerase [Nitrospirota bacterium]